MEDSQIQELLKDRPDLRIFNDFGGYATLADDFHLPATYAQALEKLLRIHYISMNQYITRIRVELKKDWNDRPEHVLDFIIRDIESSAAKGSVTIGSRRLSTSEKAYLMSCAKDTRWDTFQENFEYLSVWNLSEADVKFAPLSADRPK